MLSLVYLAVLSVRVSSLAPEVCHPSFWNIAAIATGSTGSETTSGERATTARKHFEVLRQYFVGVIEQEIVRNHHVWESAFVWVKSDSASSPSPFPRSSSSNPARTSIVLRLIETIPWSLGEGRIGGEQGGAPGMSVRPENRQWRRR